MSIAPQELLKLKRFNTPTVYNGWEQITRHDAAHDCFNLEETHDFMPQMGSMIGYAVTVICEPGNAQHKVNNPGAAEEYRTYISSIPGPKIVIVQDLDKPSTYGSFWGEVNAATHLALGCVGTITDGAVRDLDEMTALGFKAISRRLCVGHAHSTPVSWNCEVEVFGTRVLPGQLIHADKHGFLVIPNEDQKDLIEATRFMDENECNTVIAAARDSSGMAKEELLRRMSTASKAFSAATDLKFLRKGEW